MHEDISDSESAGNSVASAASAEAGIARASPLAPAHAALPEQPVLATSRLRGALGNTRDREQQRLANSRAEAERRRAIAHGGRAPHEERKRARLEEAEQQDLMTPTVRPQDELGVFSVVLAGQASYLRDQFAQTMSQVLQTDSATLSDKGCPKVIEHIMRQYTMPGSADVGLRDISSSAKASGVSRHKFVDDFVQVAGALHKAERLAWSGFAARLASHIKDPEVDVQGIAFFEVFCGDATDSKITIPDHNFLSPDQLTVVCLDMVPAAEETFKPALGGQRKDHSQLGKIQLCFLPRLFALLVAGSRLYHRRSALGELSVTTLHQRSGRFVGAVCSSLQIWL